MANLELIVSLICALATSGIFNIVLYRKVDKRTKTAEAFEKEVIALKGAMEGMETSIMFMQKRLEELQKEMIEKDAYGRQLRREKHVVEIKHSRNKSAINKAYECAHHTESNQCPVLCQKSKNDEEYLKELEKLPKHEG